MKRSAVSLLIIFFGLVSASHSHNAHGTGKHTSVEYAVKGDFSAAKDALSEQLKNDPFNTQAQSSREIIEDVLNKKIEPETAVLLLQGIEYYNEGNSDMAITLFSKAILVKSDYAVTYMNRGLSYALADQHSLAVSDYNRAIELRAEYIKAYISRGIAYAKKGEYNHAFSDYDKAAEIDDRNPDVYYNRAVAHTKKGSYDRAILNYDKTIEINPKHVHAYTNRGFIYREHLEEKTKACSDWKQACTLGSCRNYFLAQKEGYCE
jgi:tetratricopeptide (TPR) repeat protein